MDISITSTAKNNTKHYRLTRRNLMACTQAAAALVAPLKVDLSQKIDLTLATAHSLAVKLSAPQTQPQKNEGEPTEGVSHVQ